jgi:hypothetical protein
MKVLSGREAIDAIARTGALSDAQIQGPLSLRLLCDNDETCSTEIRLKRCQIELVDAPCVAFTRPVTLEDCTLARAEFFSSYFLQGLSIRGTRFASPVDFQCGGHNGVDFPVRILDTVFEGFANFFDCWYMGPVEVMRCKFQRGTNLLGNKTMPYRVKFDVSPVVLDNEGFMDMDGESAA